MGDDSTNRRRPDGPDRSAALPTRRRGRFGLPGRAEQPPATQVVAAAGGAVVSAARVGRLLGRTGWRIARQLPGVDVVEAQAQKLRQAATHEMLRMLEVPQQLFGSATPEEQRAMLLVQNGHDDPEPLRTAMTELLQRSTEPGADRSQDYLFGTIVSQLVPDEARILAALVAKGPFASVDVVAKQIGRSSTRTVQADVSPVGIEAGIATPASTPTYLGRLRSFGLVEITTDGNDSPTLADQYDVAENDQAVVEARGEIEKSRLGSARIVRKTVRLTPLGRDFWAACAPSRAALEKNSG